MTMMTGDPFHAFLDYPDVAVPHARSGPLAGKTLAVKDIFDVAGYPSGWGNPGHAERSGRVGQNAGVVQALLQAGARFIGKTQTDELASHWMGQNSHYPFPINPAAPDRITGGSSSGSAAAVAGRLADIAFGSDTGGSIRAPASFCGLIGLRTTHGAIALDGVMPLASSFDTVGWFAGDMDSYDTVARLLLPAEQSVRMLARPFRIAALDELVLPQACADYERLVADVARATGAARPAAVNHTVDALYRCFTQLQPAEAWRSHRAWLASGMPSLDPRIRQRLAAAGSISKETVREETRRRAAFRAEMTELLADDGFIVLPTVPGAAPLVAEPDDLLATYRDRAIKLLCWAGLAGLPQLTLPLGRVASAPFGISLLGPAGSDLALLRLGRRILMAGKEQPI